MAQSLTLKLLRHAGPQTLAHHLRARQYASHADLPFSIHDPAQLPPPPSSSSSAFKSSFGDADGALRKPARPPVQTVTKAKTSRNSAKSRAKAKEATVEETDPQVDLSLGQVVENAPVHAVTAKPVKVSNRTPQSFATFLAKETRANDQGVSNVDKEVAVPLASAVQQAPTQASVQARTAVSSSKLQPINPVKFLTSKDNLFFAWRHQHRVAMWNPTYEAPEETTSGISPSKAETETHPQPHQVSLTDRYDWRLTAPSRSTVHQYMYGQKKIWRKQRLNMLDEDSATMLGYAEYRERFVRYIELERTEAENAVLLRLKKTSGDTNSTFTDKAQHIAGLSATRTGAHQGRSQHTKGKGKEKVVVPTLTAQSSSLAPNFKAGRTEPEVLEQVATDIEREAVSIDSIADEYDSKPANETVIAFSFANGQQLPTNDFHQGKMVFIWECARSVNGSAWSVPALEDSKATWKDIRDVPIRGYVQRAYTDRIDVVIKGQWPADADDGKNPFYRLDIGYDDTSFARMLAAVELYLPCDAKEAREDNSESENAMQRSRNLEVRGTELRGVILKDYAQQAIAEGFRMPAQFKKAALESIQEAKSNESDLLLSDQRLASWARRYSRHDPVRIDGDPDLDLNDTQLRAVAMSILNRMMLIQGPPGTGKTATIVAALKLLKHHFAIAPPILVCAHTNVAVDLLTAKCAEAGLKPLRFGSQERVSADVLPHSFHHRFANHKWQSRLQITTDKEAYMETMLEKVNTQMLDTVVPQSRKRKTDLTEREIRKQLQNTASKVEADLKNARMKIVQVHKEIQSDLIESSDICLTTCIGATSWTMTTADFPLVIVDEAGQCDEPATLVPLMKGARHVTLIGDHKQLPAVARNEASRSAHLNDSLFERLMHDPDIPSVLLDMQYRMLPSISAFPNVAFYNGNIRDHEDRIAAQASSLEDAVTFVHHDSTETQVGLSIGNAQEVEVIMDLVSQMHTPDAGSGPAKALEDIGIISTYAAQTLMLRTRAAEIFGNNASKLEISTVDGFQGREKDVILLSTVRANDRGNIGFLADPRRLNVALTRAKNRILVVGNMHTLGRVNPWITTSPVFVRYITWARRNGHIRRWLPISDSRLLFADTRKEYPLS